jgi:hypothetical protein
MRGGPGGRGGRGAPRGRFFRRNVRGGGGPGGSVRPQRPRTQSGDGGATSEGDMPKEGGGPGMNGARGGPRGRFRRPRQSKGGSARNSQSEGGTDKVKVGSYSSPLTRDTIQKFINLKPAKLVLINLRVFISIISNTFFRGKQFQLHAYLKLAALAFQYCDINGAINCPL